MSGPKRLDGAPGTEQVVCPRPLHGLRCRGFLDQRRKSGTPASRSVRPNRIESQTGFPRLPPAYNLNLGAYRDRLCPSHAQALRRGRSVRATGTAHASMVPLRPVGAGRSHHQTLPPIRLSRSGLQMCLHSSHPPGSEGEPNPKQGPPSEPRHPPCEYIQHKSCARPRCFHATTCSQGACGR